MGSVAHQDGYLLANRQVEAGERFGALAELFDRSTFLHMERLGIAAGWQCWEVGAGGPNVASWMADRVGTTGSVLATDIDLSWMGERDGCGFEVQRHDVGLERPPPGPFDLIHARLSVWRLLRRPGGLRRQIVGDIRCRAHKHWLVTLSKRAAAGPDSAFGLGGQYRSRDGPIGLPGRKDEHHSVGCR